MYPHEGILVATQGDYMLDSHEGILFSPEAITCRILMMESLSPFKVITRWILMKESLFPLVEIT